MFRYSQPKELTITAPASGLVTNATAITVSGTVKGAGITGVKVNNVAATMNGYSFVSGPFALTEGSNTVTVKATFASGTTITKTVAVTRDTSAPVLTGITPVAGTLFNTSQVTVSGTITDASMSWVFVNGRTADISGGRFSIILAFPDGTNTIKVEAKDISGNKSGQTVLAVTNDTTPPVQFTVTANPSSWTNNTRPVISFVTTDATSGIARYELSADGGVFATAVSPYTLAPLADGEHTVTVKAMDKAGWSTTAETNVFIDTVPPTAPGSFNLVPGNGNVELSWTKPSEDTISYQIERTPAWPEQYKTITATTFKDEQLTNGATYSYRVRAIDRANNASAFTDLKEAISGLEIVPYTPGTEIKAEYENVTLFMPKEGLPEETALVLITEAASEGLAEVAQNPIVSPIYEFSIRTATGADTLDSHLVDGSYFASIAYDPAKLPAGFQEENLSVWYFDTFWGRWIELTQSAVDTTHHTIDFVSSHFSLYSVQATETKDLTPDEYRDAGYSPLKTYSVHSSLTVSPQGGSVGTSATELVFPGPAGFDMTIARRFDSATAKNDARAEGPDATTKPAWGNSENYLLNTGDYIYSMGKGWRLDLPYIKNANADLLISLPGGGLESIQGMHKTAGTNLLHLELYDHEGADFTLSINRTTATKIVYHTYTYSYTWYDDKDLPHQESGTVTNIDPITYYVLSDATLRMKDGTTYTFDKDGLCTRITNPTGLAKITIAYDQDSTYGYRKIKEMKDDLGRRVSFTYELRENLPMITGMSVDSDVPDSTILTAKRTISYTIDDTGYLTRATDAGGRTWYYQYEAIPLSGECEPIPTVVKMMDYDKMNKPDDNLKARSRLHAERLIKELRGPGKGVVRVTYSPFSHEDFTRTMASDVSIFNNAADPGAAYLVRNTSYNYEFEKKKTETDDPDSKQKIVDEEILVKKAIETDGNRITEYEYEQIEKPINFWEESNTGISDTPRIQRTAWQGRAIRTVKKDGTTELEREVTAYADNKATRPMSVTTYHGYEADTTYNSRSITTLDNYDTWNNVHKTTTTSEIIVDGVNRIAKTETYREYVNNDPGMDTTKGWREYGAGGAELTTPTLTTPRYDLPKGEMTIIYGEDGTTVANKQYTYYQYNALGQMTKTARWDSSNDKWAKTNYLYDNEDADYAGTLKVGNITKKTDAMSHETSYTYDAETFPVSVTEKNIEYVNGAQAPMDITTYSHYDDMTGWKLWDKNPRGYFTEYEYDKLGRVTKTTLPGDGESANTGDATPPANRTNNPYTTVTYNDNAGALSADFTDTMARKTHYAYNDLGQLERIVKYKTSVSAPLAITTLTYNKWGEITSITDPDGNAPSAEPDYKHTTWFSYDAMGRRIETVYADETNGTTDNPRTTSVFDYANDTLTVTNELGHNSYEIHDITGKTLKQITNDGNEDIVSRAFYDGAGNLVRSIGPRGEETRYTYNSLNQVTRVIAPVETLYDNAADKTGNPRRPVTITEYDLRGVKVRDMQTVADANGTEIAGTVRKITEYTTDALGRVYRTTQKTSEQGAGEYLARTTVFFDANGNKVREYDANNPNPGATGAKYVSYIYSSRDKVLTQTDQAGNVTSYTYNADDSVATITGPQGNAKVNGEPKYTNRDFTIAYHYDNLARIDYADFPKKSATATTKPRVSFTYDPRGNLITKTDADGSVTSYEYYPRNLKKTETITGYVNETPEKSYSISYEYNRAGLNTKITDKRGKVTKQDYDPLNRLQTIIYPLRNTTSFVYDKANNKTRVTDGNGHATVTTYDFYNRPLTVTYPEGNVESAAYDIYGRKVRTNNSLMQERTYEYDDLDRLVTETDPLGYEYAYEYFANGNVSGTTDPNGTTSTYQYTDNNLVSSITLQNGSKTKTISYGYDEGGNVVSRSNGDVTTTFNGYDSLHPSAYSPDPYGRIMNETRTDGTNDFATAYAYDLADRITGVTYPNDQTLTYGYNSIGELKDVPGYTKTGTTISYDGGLVSKEIAANGVATDYAYDDNSRLTGLSYGGTTQVKAYTFKYDDANNIIQRNNDIFVYDNENRLIRAELEGAFTVNAENRKQSVGVAREDLFGNKNLDFNLEYAVTNPNLVELDYAAGSIGVNLGAAYPVTKIVLTPDATQTRVNANDIRVFMSDTYSFTKESELQSPMDFTATKSTVDGKAQITIKLTQPREAQYVKIKTDFDERNSDFTCANVAEFKNDPDKLIKVYYNLGERTEKYTLDKLGNRTTTDIDTEGAASMSRYYPINGVAIANGHSDRLMTDGTFAYQYDANGNTTKQGDKIKVGDSYKAVKDVAETEWASITDSTSSIDYDITGSLFFEYQYDLLNRMVVVQRNGQTIASYEYDESGLLFKKTSTAGETLYTWSPNGKLLYEETGTAFKRYIYVNGDLFAYEKGTTGSMDVTQFFVHTDQVGSVTAITDAAGAKVWENEYTPYGELADKEKLPPDGMQYYAGHFYDADAALYYANARWYDPTTGRFISVDPVKDGLNWYVYGGNNPLVMVDPTGLEYANWQEAAQAAYDANHTLAPLLNDIRGSGDCYWYEDMGLRLLVLNTFQNEVLQNQSLPINDVFNEYPEVILALQQSLGTNADKFLNRVTISNLASLSLKYGTNSNIRSQLNSQDIYNAVRRDIERDVAYLKMGSAGEVIRKIDDLGERYDWGTQFLNIAVGMAYNIQAGTKSKVDQAYAKGVTAAQQQIINAKRLDIFKKYTAESEGTTVLASPNIQHINGAIGEAHGYADALRSGQLGIQAPGKVTETGPDYITYDPTTGKIVVWDAKYSSTGQFPSTVKGFGSQSWLNKTRDAIDAISDPVLRAQAQKAFQTNNIDWQIYKWPQ